MKPTRTFSSKTPLGPKEPLYTVKVPQPSKVTAPFASLPPAVFKSSTHSTHIVAPAPLLPRLIHPPEILPPAPKGLSKQSSPAHTINNHVAVVPPANPVVNEQLVKQYTPLEPTEYLALEGMLAAMIGAIPSSSALRSSPRLSLFKDFYAKEGRIVVVRDRGKSVLADHLNTLGMKRIFKVEDAWRIISDLAEGARELHECQITHLGIKLENIILDNSDGYRLADVFFNEHVIGWIRKEEFRKRQERLKVFPHLDGKTEHTVVIFGKDSNEYINTKNFSKDISSKNATKSPPSVWSPYSAPETLTEQVQPVGGGEFAARCDSFSLGMVFLRLLCAISDQDFTPFESLNKQTDDTSYNKILYDIVRFGERCGYDKELSVIVQLLMKDPINRLSADKLFNFIQAEYYNIKGNQKKQPGIYQVKPYKLDKYKSYKNEYLKNKLMKGSLEIHCRNDFKKLSDAAGENIQTLKMFFFNEHIGDKDVRDISDRIAHIAHLEKIIADFGNYPQITDLGFTCFIDAISKFSLKSLTISLGTSELSTTVNITDDMVKRLARMLKSSHELVELELNLKNRMSISSESVLALKDALEDKKGMKKVRVYLEGTRADQLYCKQLDKLLRVAKTIPDVRVGY